jgi:uncharacterized membrane protein YkoI
MCAAQLKRSPPSIRRRGRSAIGALAAILGAALALSTAAPALAARSTMNGARFEDGLDTRLAAQRVGEAARNAGYESSWYFGRSALDSWNDGRDSSVYGLFGHATGATIQTAEGPTDDRDHLILAGKFTTPDTSFGSRYFWKDYVPDVDVDDMKLAIMAGCYSATDDPELGSFPRMGFEQGIDSVIGFGEFVYYPNTCTGTTGCAYSGNYFWERFAVYAEAGDTVSTALSKAQSDLVTKEGDAAGWDSWSAFGASDAPGSVRLTPASDGQYADAKPFGIDPFNPYGLLITSSRGASANGFSYTDYATAEGVEYRVLERESTAAAASTTKAAASSEVPTEAPSPPETALEPNEGEPAEPQLPKPELPTPELPTPESRPPPSPDSTDGEVEPEAGVSAPERPPLVWLKAPVSTEGEVRLDEGEARKTALEFLSTYVDRFDRERFDLMRGAEATHLEEDALYRFTWRPKRDGRPGSAVVAVEVDRRTGAVVFLSAAEPKARSTEKFAISKEEAVDTARKKAGGGELKSARAEFWERPRWTVTIDQRDGEPTPRLVKVTVDGESGEVASTSST